MEDSYYMIWLAIILMDVFCMLQLATRLLFTVKLTVKNILNSYIPFHLFLFIRNL